MRVREWWVGRISMRNLMIFFLPNFLFGGGTIGVGVP